MHKCLVECSTSVLYYQRLGQCSFYNLHILYYQMFLPLSLFAPPPRCCLVCRGADNFFASFGCGSASLKFYSAPLKMNPGHASDQIIIFFSDYLLKALQYYSFIPFVRKEKYIVCFMNAAYRLHNIFIFPFFKNIYQ